MVSAVSRVATISPRRMTETSSVTAMISRSLWVIRMIVFPCALQLPEDAEEMVGLVGRQHAGRLVEDQRVGAAIERLQDLHALLQADRQLADDRVGIDLQRVFALEPLQLARAHARCRAFSSVPPSTPSMTFSSTVNGSTSMKCWCTMPMPAAIAASEEWIGDLLAVDADRAGVGMVEAVEDRHQRRFAGAVLADDAVDRALGDGEVDVPVGVDRAEALVDADELDRGRQKRRRAHRTSSMPNGPAATRSGCGAARISAQ